MRTIKDTLEKITLPTILAGTLFLNACIPESIGSHQRILGTYLNPPQKTLTEKLSEKHVRNSILEIRGRRHKAEDKTEDKKEIITPINEAYLFSPDIESALNRIYEEKKGNLPSYLTLNSIRATIWVESSGRPRKTSPDNAKGLMQITDGACRQVNNNRGCRDAYNIEENLSTGIEYLRWINGECEKHCPFWNALSDRGKLEIVSASYNGGVYHVQRRGWDVSDTFSETQNHARKVLHTLGEIEGEPIQTAANF